MSVVFQDIFFPGNIRGKSLVSAALIGWRACAPPEGTRALSMIGQIETDIIARARLPNEWRSRSAVSPSTRGGASSSDLRRDALNKAPANGGDAAGLLRRRPPPPPPHQFVRRDDESCFPKGRKCAGVAPPQRHCPRLRTAQLKQILPASSVIQ